MKEYQRLFAPGKIGKLEIKNRIAMAAMAMFYVSEDGSVSDRQLAYYAERARGGVGVIITEAAYPRRKPYPMRLEINDDKYIPGLSRLAAAVHNAGAKIILQMNVGRGRGDVVECVSASDVPTPGTGVKPRALAVAEIETLVKEFGEGATRARKAGFDGIEIHANGGYLVDEFLSPFTNRRTDEYGGSVERRAKFALDLVRAAKSSAGSDYPVLFKLMSDEHMEGGLQPSQAIVICQLLEKAGLDAVEVVSGNFHMTDEWAIAPMSIPRCYNIGLSAAIKKNIGIPVLVGGRIIEPNEAEDILLQGKADFISLGRALMADPEWPNKASAGRSKDISKCISCLHCMDDLFKRGKGATCTVNPALGEEASFIIKPASKKKRVLVIGGGPAGMEAARVCALRGHEVTLWEKGTKLGGTLNVAIKPPHKEELNTILDYLPTQINKLGVKIELEKEATAESVSKFAPDVVIVATGASPATLDIPGANRRNVVSALKVLAEEAEVGQDVVVIGGGLVGCETADFLSERGKNVTVLEILEQVASDLGRTNRKMILDRLIRADVKMVTKFKPMEITEKGVKGVSDSSTVLFPADTVIMAVGMKPNDKLAKALKGRVADLYVIGDSAKPCLIFDATYEGAHTGIKI